MISINSFDCVTGEIFPSIEINSRKIDYPQRQFLPMHKFSTPLLNLDKIYFGFMDAGFFTKTIGNSILTKGYPRSRIKRPYYSLAIDIAYMKFNGCGHIGDILDKCDECTLYDPMSDHACLCKIPHEEYIQDEKQKEIDVMPGPDLDIYITDGTIMPDGSTFVEWESRSHSEICRLIESLEREKNIKINPTLPDEYICKSCNFYNCYKKSDKPAEKPSTTLELLKHYAKNQFKRIPHLILLWK